MTTTTLFQAGSISKPVTALGALQLVAQGRVRLDESVNEQLESWELPENACTQDCPVTPRALLSHEAGVNVHGFPGYERGARLPDLREVLGGSEPANTPPIRVESVPGEMRRYSGGGYTVLQQLMIDATGATFPRLLHATVLEPLGMKCSTFAQPLPRESIQPAAVGHGPDGKRVAGQWRVYPEMAAAGLWTTAGDLARFALGIQQAWAGGNYPGVSPQTARWMLTPQRHGGGLGLMVGSGASGVRFWHGGRNQGYDAFMAAEAGGRRKGVAVLCNSKHAAGSVSELVTALWKDGF